MHHISKTINELRATKKRGEKVDIMKSSDIDFQILTYLALNPYIKFNRSPQPSIETSVLSTESISDLLEALLEDCNTHTDMKTRGELFDVFNKEVYERTGSYVFQNMILQEDIDCGVGAKTFNEATSYLQVPEFNIAKAAEAAKLEALFDNGSQVYGCLKIDGARGVLTVFEDMSMTLQTSSGNYLKTDMCQKIFTNVKEKILKNNMKHLLPFQLDGELAQHDGTDYIDRSKNNGIVNKMRHGSATEKELELMKFFVFDFLPGEDAVTDGVMEPLSSRIKKVKMFNGDVSDHAQSVQHVLIKTFADAMEYAKMLIDLGQEGAVFKDVDSPWLPKRMNDWVKVKAFATVDVKVVGWTPHKKDDSQIGSLIISSSCGKIKSGIGTGAWLTQERRRELKKLADSGYLDSGEIILEVRSFAPTYKKSTDTWAFNIPSILSERKDKRTADDFDKIIDMFPSLRKKK